MTRRYLTIAIFLLLGTPAAAQDLLPVAQGHQSAAFVMDGRTARLSQGARVEFILADGNGVPRKVPYVTGFVLGMFDDVVFIELSDRSAAVLAKHRAQGDVSYQKIRDPEAEEVAVRRKFRDSGHAVLLAPQMRRLTVRMAVDGDTVGAWSPGDRLTFFGAREFTRRTMIDGEWKPQTAYRDVGAMFRSATPTADGQFDVTIVADPYVVEHLLRAELKGRLTVDRDAGPAGTTGNRCYIAHRRGTERIEVEIPCQQ